MPAALRCRLLALALAACALALPQAARSEEMVDCIVMTSGGGVGQSAAAECASLLWPLPKGYKAGATTRAVDSAFAFDLHGAAADSAILKAAAARYRTLLFVHGGLTPTTTTSESGDDTNATTDDTVSGGAATLVAVHIVIEEAGETFSLGTKESFQLHVPSTGDAQISAPTVFGALHALETLSQLVSFDPDAYEYTLAHTPLLIDDAPRFAYRGLMVDAARHFMPKAVLQRTIDAMSAAKLNVLHLHLSDMQSFPVQVKKYPKLWSAAYSTVERYRQRELADLVAYASARGVAIVPEFDTPGHSKSMCAGAPAGACMANCSDSNNWPLRPVELAFDFLRDLWAEYEDIFPFDMRHVGGDEVKSLCWAEDAVSAAAMDALGLNHSETWVYFVNRNANLSLSQARRPIMWNDAWSYYQGDVSSDDDAYTSSSYTLDEKLTIMFWTSYAGSFQAAADAGHDVIAASGDPWYFSTSADYSVRDAYEYDPCDCSNAVNAVNCVNTSAACDRVLGVEGAFWATEYDASQLDNTLWPRAAALAERAWSDAELVWYTNTSQADGNGATVRATATRLGAFRCHLMNRGVASLGTTVEWDYEYGSERISLPGSCMIQ